jgi:hypothetical protein
MQQVARQIRGMYSEMLVHIWTTWCYVPEYGNSHKQHVPSLQESRNGYIITTTSLMKYGNWKQEERKVDI